MASVPPPSDATVIVVNGRAVHPNSQYARDAKNTDFIIVTCYDILNTDQSDLLIGMGVEFLEDLGSHNYLCRYKPSDLDSLRALVFVRQVDVYRNKFKIPADLLILIESATQQPTQGNKKYFINIMTHSTVSDLGDVARSMSSRVGLDEHTMQVFQNKICVEAELDQLQAIAADDRVRILEEVVVPKLQGSAPPASFVLGEYLGQGLGVYKGAGQVISVIDSGFDLGSAENCHPAFHGRIEKLISLGRANNVGLTEEQRVDDPVGHGTHVCGIIVGKEVKTPYGPVGGVAPEAKLIVTSFMKNLREQVPVHDIRQSFGVPFTEHDARIMSNSWGDDTIKEKDNRHKARIYADQAKEIDNFVRSNPEALVVFSAGNNDVSCNPLDQENDGRPSLGSQAAAKNCLTVGASGSTLKVQFEDGGRNIFNADTVYSTSGRGPVDNRIKPDVVAPGHNIFSAFSQHKKVTCSEPKTTSEEYPGSFWQIRTGTSHAAPLVAGFAAILRQIVQDRGCKAPPATLLKAAIINGADVLPGVSIAKQGFGRINLKDSAASFDRSPVEVQDIGPIASPLHLESGSLIGPALKQGERIELTLSPSQPVEGISRDDEFKITLVYNDIGNREIQNNLNLRVTDLADTVVLGYKSENNMTLQNNVEQVVLNHRPGTRLKVEVEAQKILPGSSQDFALAWLVRRKKEWSKTN